MPIGLLIILSTLAPPASAQWINEIHYDNDGGDVGEGVEVVLPASANPARFDLHFYNGNGGVTYLASRNVGADFTEGETAGGYVVYSIAIGPIQNGSPDGLALTEDGVLIPGQFLSYEGTFEAVGGPADDQTSTDIGVAEGENTPVGFSLQLTGSGSAYGEFTWQSPAEASFGSVNDGQALLVPPTTQIQVIHNSPDPAFTEVDVYVDGILIEDDLAFRTGTPFFDIPANRALEVAVAPGDSKDASDAVRTRTYTFDGRFNYHFVLRGVGEGAFEPNPDGGDIIFTFRPYPDARTASETDDMLELNFVNGLTDAPRIDVRLGATLLFNNTAYGPARPYRAIAAEPQTWEITTADGMKSLGLFEVDLTGRAGEAGTLRTSGFLTPENEDDTNGEPPSFGLLFVFADGSEEFVEPITVSNEGDAGPPPTFALGEPHPNPSVGSVTVPLMLAATTEVRLAVYDVLGREVAVLHDGPLASGRHAFPAHTGGLPNGTYFVRAVVAGAEHTTARFTVVR